MLRRLTIVLLSSVAMTGIAQAQAAATNPPPEDNTAPQVQGTPDAVGEIVVTANRKERAAGQGQVRLETAPSQIQTITREAIDVLNPGANPVSLIANVPSLNVNLPDAFGLQGGANIQMHGLPSGDIGYLLDGLPQSYNGAAYAMEIVDAEDLERVSVAPGSSNLGDPTINSAAGTIYLSMRAPSDDFGVRVQGAAGSLNYNREYIRVDTGALGKTDIRGFVSYSHASGDNFRGAGGADNQHVDTKWVRTFDNGSYVTLAGSLHRFEGENLTYPTLAQLNAGGYENPAFNLTKTYSGITSTSYYKLNGQHPYYIGLVWLPTRFVANDKLTFDDTPYFWFGKGASASPTTLRQGSTFSGTVRQNVDLTKGGTIPLTGISALTVTDGRGYYIQYGNVAKVTYRTGINEFVAGFWYEGSNVHTRRIIGAVNQATGEPYDLWDSASYYKLPDGSPYYASRNNVSYSIYNVFAGDTLSMADDRLKVTAGLKYVWTNLKGRNLLPGTTENVSISSNEPLPRFSASFKVDDQFQIYANVERDFRLPSTMAPIGRYSTASGFRSLAGSQPKPELAWKEEAGVRYHDSLLIADLSVFNITLRNRLLTVNTFDNGAPITLTTNAGSQTSRGVDAQLGTVPLGGFFSPYVAMEYLHAEITSDTAATNTAGGADFLPTKGKTQIQSPKWQLMGGAQLTFGGGFFAGGRVRYVSSQYSTLVNDQKVDSYISNDVNFGYEWDSDTGFFKRPKIQVNLSNLTDKHIANGVYSYSNNANPVVGRNGGTIAAGAAPQYYLQAPFAAIVSISSNF